MKFRLRNDISTNEINAAVKVLKSGTLSKFVGEYGKDFYGGPYVQRFENLWKKYFRVKYAVSFNSWTSGLVAIIGALDIQPGDEVILPTWTMCGCSSAILHWNAIPVFADIDKETFNICPISLEKNITPKTKAIMAVDIFGQSCEIDKILKIAKKHKLKVITDSAQSIGSYYNKKYTGTFADVGGFSLNYHKHIHTGEGGVAVTNNKDIYKRLLLIRNHGESVVKQMRYKNISNIVGHNFRLGEIESAIGIEQLKKLKKIVNRTQNIAKNLTRGLKNFKGLKTPFVRKQATHAYYVYPLKIDEFILKNTSRNTIVKKLNKLGVPVYSGFSNLHLLPMFQRKIAYGNLGFPWTLSKRNINYSKGICPNAEYLHQKSFMYLGLTEFNYSKAHIKFIISSFKKVWHQFINIK
jgi:dTDP-4-amino-4,6-dideoxygalactose transaminase